MEAAAVCALLGVRRVDGDLDGARCCHLGRLTSFGIGVLEGWRDAFRASNANLKACVWLITQNLFEQTSSLLRHLLSFKFLRDEQS